MNKIKVSNFLCGMIAIAAAVIATPSTFMWMYEPKKPAKLNK